MGVGAGAGLTTFGNSLFKIAGTAESSRRRREDLGIKNAMLKLAQDKFDFQKSKDDGVGGLGESVTERLIEIAAREQARKAQEAGVAAEQSQQTFAKQDVPTIQAGIQPGAPAVKGFDPNVIEQANKLLVEDVLSKKEAASVPIDQRVAGIVADTFNVKSQGRELINQARVLNISAKEQAVLDKEKGEATDEELVAEAVAAINGGANVVLTLEKLRKFGVDESLIPKELRGF